MARIVYRLKPNGKVYASLEEAYRDAQGRPRQRHLQSLGPVGGNVARETRDAAGDRYRQVLRDNRYLYGKVRSGDRYASEARARAEYQKYLAGAKEGEFTKEVSPEEAYRLRVAYGEVGAKSSDPTETRHAMYKVSHPSPSYRAHTEYMSLKAKVEAEVHKEQATTPPAPNYKIADEIEHRHAARDAGIDEYNEVTGGSPLTEAEHNTMSANDGTHGNADESTGGKSP